MVPPTTPTAIHVSTAPNAGYDIVYDRLEETPALMQGLNLRPGRCLLVTDENVAAFHADRLLPRLEDSGWRPTLISVPPGEASKSIDTLDQIYERALSAGVDRGTPLLALGGGVVGDLAGFAAATLLRGIPLVQLPTTLIAAVDSSIGGKTGVNHRLGKNLIGAFHQPRLVVCDLSTLMTLNDREWASGLAEIVKHGLISDRSLFDFLVRTWPEILRRDEEKVAEVVPRAAAVKKRVVELDERESGVRAHLNFGHTFGHAIERVAGYGSFTHGEAVAVGMEVALHLTAAFDRQFELEPALALVRQIPVESDPAALDFDELFRAMQVDKKVEHGRIRFVLLRSIGEAYMRSDVDRTQMEAAWAAALRDRR